MASLINQNTWYSIQSFGTDYYLASNAPSDGTGVVFLSQTGTTSNALWQILQPSADLPLLYMRPQQYGNNYNGSSYCMVATGIGLPSLTTCDSGAAEWAIAYFDGNDATNGWFISNDYPTYNQRLHADEATQTVAVTGYSTGNSGQNVYYQWAFSSISAITDPSWSTVAVGGAGGSTTSSVSPTSTSTPVSSSSTTPSSSTTTTTTSPLPPTTTTTTTPPPPPTTTTTPPPPPPVTSSSTSVPPSPTPTTPSPTDGLTSTFLVTITPSDATGGGGGGSTTAPRITTLVVTATPSDGQPASASSRTSTSATAGVRNDATHAKINGRIGTAKLVVLTCAMVVVAGAWIS